MDRRDTVKALGTTTTLGLAGCLGRLETSQKTVVVATAEEGSSSYSFNQGFSKILSDHDASIRLDIQPAAGSPEAIRLLGRGDVDMATVTSPLIYGGYHDAKVTGANFKDDPIEIKPLQVLGFATVHQYSHSYKGRGVSTMAEENIEGKAYASGGEGATKSVYAPLEAAGINTDILDNRNISLTASPAAIREGRVDLTVGYTISNLVMPGWAQEFATDENIRVPPFTDEQKENLDKHPIFEPVTAVADDFYDVDVGVDEFPTATTGWIQVGSRDLSEEVVSEFNRVLISNSDEVQDYHAALGNFTAKFSVRTLMETVPVHTGAANYYKETGVWDDSLKT